MIQRSRNSAAKPLANQRALLVLARADSGRLPMSLEEINPIAPATKARELIRVLAEEKQQEICVRTPDLPVPNV
jgi:hypothetical protein